MSELKNLYDEVFEELIKLSEKQRQLNESSNDYLNDISVAYNYGKISGLLKVWSRLREMIGEDK